MGSSVPRGSGDPVAVKIVCMERDELWEPRVPSTRWPQGRSKIQRVSSNKNVTKTLKTEKNEHN